MTGRERIQNAFSADGADEIGAVICYEGIFIRDHWQQLTAVPWWHREAPDLERQLAWRREVADKTGQDWFCIPWFYARAVRERLAIEEREDGIYRVDRTAGSAVRLVEPLVGGWAAGGMLHSIRPERPAATEEEIDALIPEPAGPDPELLQDDGRKDLARRMLNGFGAGLYPIAHVASPFWRCYQVWGFEGLMTMVADRPELVAYACRRNLSLARKAVCQAAALGASGIWIEECMTDMIGPDDFARLSMPFLRSLIEEIRAAGLHSIYYFCGDPAGKWELLLDAGADALSLEESKKGFAIDIEAVVERVRGRCAVLGNLDAIRVLQDGSGETLRAEIARQIAAGRKNGSRFVMSLGSPVTPDTPVERVRHYCDLVHELGRKR